MCFIKHSALQHNRVSIAGKTEQRCCLNFHGAFLFFVICLFLWFCLEARSLGDTFINPYTGLSNKTWVKSKSLHGALAVDPFNAKLLPYFTVAARTAHVNVLLLLCPGSPFLRYLLALFAQKRLYIALCGFKSKKDSESCVF